MRSDLGWWLLLSFLGMAVFAQDSRQIQAFSIARLDFSTHLELFEIDASYQRELAQGDISAQLRRVFAERGYQLSSDVGIEPRDSKSWMIVDEEHHQKYLVVERGAKLGVVFPEYPWWRELYLHIEGEMSRPTKEALLKISLHYQGSLVSRFDLDVVETTQFQKSWGPLNLATEEILPGSYKIVVELPLAQQSRVFGEQWRQRFGQKEPASYEQSFSLGTERQFAAVSTQAGQFYLEVIKSLNALFKELQLQEKQALEIRRSPLSENDFAEDGQFSAEKWQRWRGEFQRKIERQRLRLHRRDQRFFPLRYPVSHEAMQNYCSILFRVERLSTQKVFRVYRVSHSGVRSREPDTVGFLTLVRYIQQLHARSAAELDIDLFRELGYLPPPRISD